MVLVLILFTIAHHPRWSTTWSPVEATTPARPPTSGRRTWHGSKRWMQHHRHHQTCRAPPSTRSSDRSESPGMKRLAVPFVAAVLAAVLPGSAPRTPVDTPRRAMAPYPGEGSSWAANAIDAIHHQREAVRHHDQLRPKRVEQDDNFLNGTMTRGIDIPFQFKPENIQAPENPAAGQLHLHPSHRRRNGVHVQPEHQR